MASFRLACGSFWEFDRFDPVTWTDFEALAIAAASVIGAPYVSGISEVASEFETMDAVERVALLELPTFFPNITIVPADSPMLAELSAMADTIERPIDSVGDMRVLRLGERPHRDTASAEGKSKWEKSRGWRR